MGNDFLLIIFVKNPVKGRVKTRLAITIGDDKALEIYKKMLVYTLKISKELDCKKAVFYSDKIDEHDMWHKAGFDQFVQRGNDLGERMHNAFRYAFSQNFSRVVIIGSDCLELEKEMMEKAFQALMDNDVVLGPAKDGGYYLIGMKKLYPALFQNKQWSTSQVFQNTMKDIGRLKIRTKLLPVLSDIDEEKDLYNNKIIEP